MADIRRFFTSNCKSMSQTNFISDSLHVGLCHDHGCGFQYEGSFGDVQFDFCLSWAEEMLAKHNEPMGIRKRVVRCLVEMLQNLQKHSGKGLAVFGFDDERRWILQTQNIVSKDEKSHLESALKSAEAPPLEDLRAERLSKLVDGERTAKGGAGLGFLDMRACSGGQVQAEFIPCDRGQFIFVLTVRIHPQQHLHGRFDH